MNGPTSLRKQPLLAADKNIPNSPSPKGRKKFGELAGGTAAECAAVCCCCPCAVMNILVLAVYRVPTGLCRKAWRKRKKRRQRMIAKKKQGGLLMGPISGDGTPRKELLGSGGLAAEEEEENEAEVDELEKEMWDHFYLTGFWRSPSQRNNEDNNINCTCTNHVHVHTS